MCTHCCRYGSVRLSTHPPSHTPNMFSWFPIYFPLKEPVTCPAGQPIQACTSYAQIYLSILVNGLLWQKPYVHHNLTAC